MPKAHTHNVAASFALRRLVASAAPAVAAASAYPRPDGLRQRAGLPAPCSAARRAAMLHADDSVRGVCRPAAGAPCRRLPAGRPLFGQRPADAARRCEAGRALPRRGGGRPQPRLPSARRAERQVWRLSVQRRGPRAAAPDREHAVALAECAALLQGGGSQPQPSPPHPHPLPDRRSAAVPPRLTQIRLLDEIDETLAFAQQLQDAGCALLAVHGRYRGSPMRRRDGPAHLDRVALIKQRLSVPVASFRRILGASSPHHQSSW
mmetsp:Transcript_6530/g.20923  ORF Transcript_6530/g.20923 Transcript_6530/m.20923 type:complete len:263 (-) Transcript_6530:87-875(-)